MGIVYKATNDANGKIYIGKTIRTLEYRIRQHLEAAAKYRRNSVFLNALRKYGSKFFVWEVLFESNDDKLLLKKEIEFIKLYKSNDLSIGYNLTKGGEGCLGRKYSKESIFKKKSSYTGNLLPYVCGEQNYNSKLTVEKVKQIKFLIYNTNETFVSIGKKFGVFYSTISEIARNKIWVDVDKELYKNRNYPIRVKSSKPGIKNTMAKLTEEKVRAIRRLYIWCKDAKKIASWFGVSKNNVYSIVSRNTWDYLDKEYV